MYRSWLIRRMKQPTGMGDHFSFGGSGFHPDMVDNLKDVCSLDYMGAAEYEFGPPVKALNRMIEGEEETQIGCFHSIL